MRSLDKIKKIIQQNKGALEDEFGVISIGLFGSYVRGGQSERSDIDILVEFKRPVGFFRFLELEEHLEKLLGLKVDLVTRKALKPAIGRNILSELVTV